MPDKIWIENERDRIPNFNGALLRRTIMPSGWVTPDKNMEYRDGFLVEIDYDEWKARTSKPEGDR